MFLLHALIFYEIYYNIWYTIYHILRYKWTFTQGYTEIGYISCVYRIFKGVFMDERLTTIKGIGPGREKQLHKLGITNVTSLLTYFPRTYEDRRTIYSIGDLKSGMTGGVVGTVIAVQEKRPRPRLSILEVVIADGTGPLKIVLFNQGYKKNFYKKGQRIYAYGKAEFQYGTMQRNTP